MPEWKKRRLMMMSRMNRINQLAFLGAMHANQDDNGGGGGGGSDNDTGTDDPSKGGDDKGAGADDPSKSDDKGDDKGKTGPSDEEAKLLKEVMTKKGRIKELEGELTALKKQFEGINVDEVRELLKGKKDEETRKLEAKGEWDKLKAQMVEAHTSEKSALEAKITELQEKLSSKDSFIEELTVGQNFSNSEFISKSLTLTPSKARIIYGAHFDVEDGKTVAYDKPRGAKDRTMLVDGSGEPLKFDEAIKKLVEADPDKDHLIRSQMKPGAGSHTDNPAKKPKVETPAPKGLSRIEKALSGGKSS